MTLREPPKQESTSRVLGRLIGLLILLAGFALVVWAIATNQQAKALERSDPQVHAPGEYVSADGTTLHVTEVGSGTDVSVLVHPDTMAGGLALLPLAQQLAEGGQRVLIPDLLGFGFSPRPSTPGRHYSVTGQSERLAALLDSLEVGSVRVVGFGWGGGVAAELALTRPDLVSRVILVDTAELPADLSGWGSLEGLPFGLGDAISFTREGASAGAEARYLEGCPAGLDCVSNLESYRRAVQIPGTSRSIMARRASEPASLESRFDAIEAPVTLAAVGLSAADVAEAAARFSDPEIADIEVEGLAALLMN